jgi:hypothetical protein
VISDVRSMENNQKVESCARFSLSIRQLRDQADGHVTSQKTRYITQLLKTRFGNNSTTIQKRNVKFGPLRVYLTLYKVLGIF